MGSIYLENFIDMKIFRDSFWLGRWVQAIFIPWTVVSILLVLFVMSNVDYAKLFSWCGLKFMWRGWNVLDECGREQES